MSELDYVYTGMGSLNDRRLSDYVLSVRYGEFHFADRRRGGKLVL